MVEERNTVRPELVKPVGEGDAVPRAEAEMVTREGKERQG